MRLQRIALREEVAEGGGVGGKDAEVGGHETACAARFDCCGGFGRFAHVRLRRMEFGLIPGAECGGEPVEGATEECFSTAAQTVRDEIVELGVGKGYARYRLEMVGEESLDYTVEKVVGSCAAGLAVNQVVDAKQA